MSCESVLKDIKDLAIHKNMVKTRKKNTSKCNKAEYTIHYIQETTNSLDS